MLIDLFDQTIATFGRFRWDPRTSSDT